MMDRVTLEVASLSGSEMNTRSARLLLESRHEPQTMKNEAHVSHVAMFKVGRKGKKFRALRI